MDFSNYGICYEATNRIYRNAVVAIARDRLHVRSAEPAEAVRRPFGDTWDKLVSDANERRLTGELSTEAIDDLDYLGVSQFLNLFEANFDALFQRASDVTNETWRNTRQAVLGWAREVRILRDPVSHSSEQDLPYLDALGMIDSSRRVLLQLGATEDASRLEAMLTALAGRPGESGVVMLAEEPLEGYLPPAQEYVVQFVGRQLELQELHHWIAEGRATRWALTGEGSVGKSAIAYQFAHEIRDRRSAPLQFVFWLSAKRRRFIEGAVVTVPQPDFTDLESAVAFLLFQYGEFRTGNDSLIDREDLLLLLLDQFPALIVADDIDSLEGVEESAIEFLTVKAPSTKSRVLVTSRRQPFGFGGTTTEVKGFREEEAADFIFSRARLYGLDESAFTRQAIRDILRATEGSAGYIEELVRLCTTGTAPREAARLWKDHGHAARQYALGREVELLSAQARNVLIAACVPDGPVSRVELEAATGLTADDVASAIIELQKLFLMPKPRLIESEARFDLNRNARLLVRDAYADTDSMRRARGAFESLSSDELASVARRRRVGGFISQAVALVRQDRHDEAERTLLSGLDTYPNETNLLGQLGWVYRQWKPLPRPTDARETFRRAHQLECPNEEMYRHWSEMEAELQEWSRAAEAAEAGLVFVPESSVLNASAGYARSRLGGELLRQLQPRAIDELSTAWGHLARAVQDPSDLVDFRARRLQARVFRSLLVTADMWLRAIRDPGERDGRVSARTRQLRARIATDALNYLARWQAEHPDDPNAASERTRLEPALRAVLSL